MHKIDKTFDINTVLMDVYFSLETILDENNIELIYNIGATIPKELRGNSEVLSHLLTQLLTFVFENTHKKEIVLSLTAPKDFMYKESISFEIEENDISKEQITSFFENKLHKNLELLDAHVMNKNSSDIHIDIVFKLKELGYRRHYRLPDMSMLDKKVLLICKSLKLANSIEKMFKYFLYDVTVGVDAYKKQGSNMAQYDILLIAATLRTDMLENMLLKVQKETGLKYVLLEDSKYAGIKKVDIESYSLIKPVMQESVYELIISLFENNTIRRDVKSTEFQNTINFKKYINKAPEKEGKSFTSKSMQNISDKYSPKEDNIKRVVLNIELGEKNSNKIGLVYAEELNKFLDSFTGSDKYFRRVVNDKKTWQIKEFCIDLEKSAKMLGAESMLYLASNISLLFVYDKLDVLPVYSNKYHNELIKLIVEIKRYLNY